MTTEIKMCEDTGGMMMDKMVKKGSFYKTGW